MEIGWEDLLFHDDGGCPVIMDDEIYSSELTAEEKEIFSSLTFDTGY